MKNKEEVIKNTLHCLTYIHDFIKEIIEVNAESAEKVNETEEIIEVNTESAEKVNEIETAEVKPEKLLAETLVIGVDMLKSMQEEFTKYKKKPSKIWNSLKKNKAITIITRTVRIIEILLKGVPDFTEKSSLTNGEFITRHHINRGVQQTFENGYTSCFLFMFIHFDILSQWKNFSVSNKTVAAEYLNLIYTTGKNIIILTSNISYAENDSLILSNYFESDNKTLKDYIDIVDGKLFNLFSGDGAGNKKKQRVSKLIINEFIKILEERNIDINDEVDIAEAINKFGGEKKIGTMLGQRIKKMIQKEKVSVVVLEEILGKLLNTSNSNLAGVKKSLDIK
jgi:hypothetical protein